MRTDYDVSYPFTLSYIICLEYENNRGKSDETLYV